MSFSSEVSFDSINCRRDGSTDDQPSTTDKTGVGDAFKSGTRSVEWKSRQGSCLGIEFDCHPCEISKWTAGKLSLNDFTTPTHGEGLQVLHQSVSVGRLRSLLVGQMMLPELLAAWGE